MTRESPSDVYSEALRLQSIGLSVLPIGKNKKPALETWKSFQKLAADEHQIRDWFDGRDDLGLGIIVGPISGHLVVRDFDDPNSFRRWASSNPQLAESLPTVQASRGPHVYARIVDCPFQQFADGELRSQGHYIVSPPSIHPSGCQYFWKRKLRNLADVPILNLAESGLGREWLGSDKKRKRENTTDTTESTSVLSVLSVVECQQLIAETLPPYFGTRRHRLFLLARRIRADSQLRDTPIAGLKPLVREWHRQALPTIKTKSFDDTWADFVIAHGNVDPTRCVDSVIVAMNLADATRMPIEALQYESSIVQRLVALCAELSRTSVDGVFYLSCRKAATGLGVTDHTRIAGFLKMLCADHVLLVMKPGGPHNNKASRYRYLKNKTR